MVSLVQCQWCSPPVSHFHSIALIGLHRPELALLNVQSVWADRIDLASALVELLPSVLWITAAAVATPVVAFAAVVVAAAAVEVDMTMGNPSYPSNLC